MVAALMTAGSHTNATYACVTVMVHRGMEQVVVKVLAKALGVDVAQDAAAAAGE